MPRNRSGTYIAPTSTWNPAVDGTPILSEDWNALLHDLSLALTQSLASNGQTTAAARIPFAQGIGVANGTAAAPSINFTSDPDTGFYRDAANALGIATNGATLAVFDASAFRVTGNVFVSANLEVSGNAVLGDASGDTLTVNATSTFLAPITVPDSSFTNAKLADVAAGTIKGRGSAGTGPVEDLTPAQTNAILPPMIGATQSVAGTKGLVPQPSAGEQLRPLTGAGTYTRGVGRCFGTIINTTSVDGSQPTLVGSLNVASISTVTVASFQASATITFTDPLPDTTYAVFVQGDGVVGANETSYGSRTTTTVTIYWESSAGTRELSVAGF